MARATIAKKLIKGVASKIRKNAKKNKKPEAQRMREAGGDPRHVPISAFDEKVTKLSTDTKISLSKLQQMLKDAKTPERKKLLRAAIKDRKKFLPAQREAMAAMPYRKGGVKKAKRTPVKRRT